MPALLLGIASLAAMVLVTSVDRPSHELGGSGASNSKWPGSPPATSANSTRAAGVTRSAISRCRSTRCALSSKGMRQTIQQSERARLLAQLAAGLAHQLRNSLTGARMSIQLHAKRHPPQAGDETLAVALRQLALTEEQVKGLLSAGRVERSPPEVCDLRQLLARGRAIWWVRRASMPRLLSVSRDVDGAVPLDALRRPVEPARGGLEPGLERDRGGGAGGTVSLEAYSRNGEVSIEVVDSGPGPPAAIWRMTCTSRSSRASRREWGLAWHWHARSPSTTAGGSPGTGPAGRPVSS